ncbi:hypothetical protein GLV89_15190 [Halomonas alkaliantarctica]|nr:hypothetical protein [Halomonas alkaliantarctica]
MDPRIPLPSLEEQQRIASELSALDEEIEALRNQLRACEERKQALMAHYFGDVPSTDKAAD